MEQRPVVSAITDQKLRERFEADSKGRYHLRRDGDGVYVDPEAYRAWITYQAAYRAGREDQREADAMTALLRATTCGHRASPQSVGEAVAAAIREAKP